MAFVEFRDVRKVYAMGEVEVAAVNGMTFSIERGEFVVVVVAFRRGQDHSSEHARRHGRANVRLHSA